MSFFNLTRADPDVLRVVFSSGNQNVNVIPEPHLQKLLDEAATATTSASRQELVEKASRKIVEEGHAIPLFEQAIVTGHGKNVRELQYEASTRLQLFDTWLEP